MELMGIADEGAVTIDGQIEVTQALGWRWIESRFVEVEGFEKGSIHEIPDAAFDVVADKLEESGVGIYAFGSTICNWQKTVETPFDVTLAEVARAIPRMKRLGTKYVRIMSFKPADDADTAPRVSCCACRRQTYGEPPPYPAARGENWCHHNCVCLNSHRRLQGASAKYPHTAPTHPCAAPPVCAQANAPPTPCVALCSSWSICSLETVILARK